MTADDRRFSRALAAIDALNTQDPTLVVIRGRRVPKELGHAQLLSEWIDRLAPSASKALRLAGRASHVARWRYPRSQYPEGRVGYLRWRRDLQRKHAATAAEILREQGYDEALVSRVGAIICKQGLGHDADVQVLEDALCLVFLETQLHDLVARLEQEKMSDVLRKTLRRMSPAGIALAASIPLGPNDRALLEAAARELAGG